MRIEDESLAAGLPFLRGVADHCVKELLKGAYLQRFPAHVELLTQGQPADFLHIVVEGQVEIFAEYRGRHTTINILGPGECFILAAVFLDKVYLKSARALTPVRLLLLPAAAVRTVFASDPVFAHRLGAELARGYRTLVKEVTNLKLRTSLERLANWILLQSNENGPAASFAFPFDKKTLAAKLGVTPEVLSRNFASLVPYGVIVNGKSVIVKDRSLLENFAKPSPLIDHVAD